jgi:hypothetical protein
MTKVPVRFSIQVVRGCDFKATLKAADEGDVDAQRFMIAFGEWNKRAKNASPGCFSCSVLIEPENFGGLAFLRQDAEEATTGRHRRRE